MVSVGNPYDVYLAASNANKFKNCIYGGFLTKKLTEKVIFNKKMIEEWARLNNHNFDYKKLQKTYQTFEFDQLFTFKVVKHFDNSKDYYRTFSCVEDVEKVDRPVLFIHSKNDPISRLLY